MYKIEQVRIIAFLKNLIHHARVSYRRGGEGGGAGIPPLPSHNFPYPEILKLSMVIIIISYLHVTEHKYVSSKMFRNFVPDSVRSNLRGI